MHERVWELIKKDSLTEVDKTQINSCITLISEKEGEDEQQLKEGSLTREEASVLFKETSGLLRAITELKEIQPGGAGKQREGFYSSFFEPLLGLFRE